MAPTSQVNDRLEMSGSVDSSDAKLRPIVKKELREFIEKKRQDDGLKPLNDVILWEQEPAQYELTEEELTRISHRRERNREAARKSRERRREEMDKLRKNNDILVAQREGLLAELQHLRQQHERMTSLIANHAQECDRFKYSPEFAQSTHEYCN